MTELQDPVQVDVVIVGAGLSGLLAANGLGAQGIRTVVVDKGRSVGGRLATRRFGEPAARARADHGAQFFTVRSPDFAEVVHEWRRAGIVETWCHGFGGASGDGHPRYRAVSGMNTIAKYLASTVDVETGVTVQAVTRRQVLASREGWMVSSTDGRQWLAASIILTAPVPQSLALIDAGGVQLPDQLRSALDAVTYARCLALLVQLDAPSAVPEPGGVQLSPAEDPFFSFVADNLRKGVSDVSTLTLHVHDEPSVQMWDADRHDTAQVLLRAATRWIGNARVIESQVHGWKFARPLVGHPALCAVADVSGADVSGAGRVVFAGDAFGGAKVEGAALSGLAAVEAVLA
jgi:renalase